MSFIGNNYKLNSLEISNIGNKINLPVKERFKAIEEKYIKSMSESGKLIEYDILFNYRLADNINDIITVNLEMQRDKPSYDLPARAVYYCSRILTDVLTNNSCHYLKYYL